MLGTVQRGIDTGGKSRDNMRSGDRSELLHWCFRVLFFRSGYQYFFFHLTMLAFCCNTFLMALALGFFHEFFCTHTFIAPTLTASRHLELQTEMLVPNNPAFIAIEPYFKSSEKLILVISPPFPIRNASKTCRRFSLCYFAFQQFHPSLGINYLT